MLRQVRHATGGWLWELPAGKIDAGEAPATTARRELAEKAGTTAAHRSGSALGAMPSSPGVFPAVILLYAARGLRCGTTRCQMHWMARDEALRWCHRRHHH